MSVFNCSLSFTKVKGNSELSNKNKLLSHGFINENYEITSNKFKEATKELNLLASNKLNKNVNLYEINNKIAIPNTRAFKEIDKINNLNQWKEIEFNTDIEKYNMLEWIVNGERNGISTNMLTKEQYAKQDAQTELKNEILSTSNPVLSTSKDNSFKFSLLSKQTAEFSWRNNINSRGQFELGDTLYKRINNRNINEVWSSREFTDSERKQLLLSFIQQKLSDRNSFNGKLINKINSKLGKVDFNLVDDRMFYALGNSININLDTFYNEINKTDKQNLSYYLDLVISEELIHVVTTNLINKQDIVNILQEQGLNKFLTAVDIKYENLPNSPQAYEIGVYEYIRMIVQNEFLGTTTEQVKYENKPYFLQKILQVWEFLKSVASLPKTKEIIQKHIDFIKDEIENQSEQFETIESLVEAYNKLTPEKIQQIKELKQSDSRWNKYSDEDVQRFIDSVFPESQVKEVVYHGSLNEFETFDLNKLGEFTKAPSAKEAIFFTDSIKVAETYAVPKNLDETEKGRELINEYDINNITPEEDTEYGLIEMYKKQLSDFEDDFDFDAISFKKGKNVIKGWKTGTKYEYYSNIYSVLLNIKNPEIKDFKSKSYRDNSYFETQIKAKKYGNDGTILKNTFDGREKWGVFESNIYTVFEDSQIYILNSNKAISDMEKFLKKEEDLPADSSNYNFNLPCITNK